MRGYDGAGNQVILTNRNGNVWQFQFDGANRLTNTIPPSPMQPASQTFNPQGLVSSTTDPARQTTYFYYDGKGRLTNRTDNTGTTLYRLDADGNMTNVSENGLTNSWAFDAYDRVSTYKDAYGNLIQYKYDPNGNLTNLVYPGGKNVYYTFDSNNHLTQVKDWSGRVTTLAYDLDERLTNITRPNGTYRSISYDSAGEETNIWEKMPNGLPIAWFRYDWNPNATMQWEFAAPLPHTNAPPTRSMTYDADNRLSQFQGPTMSSLQSVGVDQDGNLTNGPATNDTFVGYAYDARNRLSSAGGVANAYDAMNNRIGQTYGTNSISYVVNPNAKLPQVLLRIKNGVTNYYVYGSGLLYQVTEAPTGTNTLTYHYDYRGSTIALSGDNGLVTDRMEYSLYATLTYRAGTNDTSFLFNGRYGVMTDPNGLLYMRARYYNPYLCRFINSDPSGFAGGLNFYAYANGNPVSYLDPFGLGALGENALNSSWVILGGANVVSTASIVEPQYQLYPLTSVEALTASPLPFSSLSPASPPVSQSTATIGPIPPNPSTYDALLIGSGVPPDSQFAQGLAAMNAGLIVSAMVPGPEASVAAETTAGQTYQIMDGVRRATAANLTGATTIDAEILDANMVSQGVQQVPINSLLSPKEFIDLSGSGAYRWNRVLDGTQSGATLPPIQITPGSIGTPIRNVTIGQP